MRNKPVIFISAAAVILLLWLGYSILAPGGIDTRAPVVVSVDKELSKVADSLTQTETEYQRALQNIVATQEAERARFEEQSAVRQSDITRQTQKLQTLRNQLTSLHALQTQLVLSRTLQLETQSAQLEALRQTYQQQLQDLDKQIESLRSNLAEMEYE